MAKAKTAARKIKVTLVRSPIGYPQPQKDTVRALGLRRMNQTVEHPDSPALRGMLAKVVHLLRVEE
ncbi:MAG: 50S ribosomal protein L30 [Chloroflexi bacterium]|nr:50S ribosomal protein L30 [Chloroflexota bacterium]